MQLNFKEWITYKPPPSWINQALDKTVGHVGTAIGSGLHNAAQKSGLSAQMNSDRFNALLTNPGYSPRLDGQDRNYLASIPTDKIKDLPRYYLLKVVLHDGASSEDVKNYAFNLPDVQYYYKRGELDSEQMKPMPIFRGLNGSTTYAFKIGKL
jgi:hypothetical protein